MKKRIVVVGNGMAADRLVSKIFEYSESELLRDELPLSGGFSQQYSITIIGDESHNSYNRTLLSLVLSKQLSNDDIYLKKDEWYWDNRVTLLRGKGRHVKFIDKLKKKLICIDGTEVYYDQLILALGSQPIRIPALDDGSTRSVFYYRSLADVKRIESRIEPERSAVVIGAGLLGLEAAEVLAFRGMQVTVIDRQTTPLDKQLDPVAGRLLQTKMERLGITFRMTAEVRRLGSKNGCVSYVELDDGYRIEASMVVFAIGVKPNIELADHSSIECDRGILVDEALHTSDKDIFAIGECSQYKEHTFGFVTPVYQQADVLAKRLLGFTSKFQFQTFSATLKVSGVQVFSLGEINESLADNCITYLDDISEVYKKLLIKDNKLVGTILYGDLTGASRYQEVFDKQVTLDSTLCEQLIFHPLNMIPPISLEQAA